MLFDKNGLKTSVVRILDLIENQIWSIDLKHEVHESTAPPCFSSKQLYLFLACLALLHCFLGSLRKDEATLKGYRKRPHLGPCVCLKLNLKQWLKSPTKNLFLRIPLSKALILNYLSHTVPVGLIMFSKIGSLKAFKQWKSHLGFQGRNFGIA